MLFKAENVSKSFRDKDALIDINLNVPEGIIFGLLGPNGAGKTTFIRIINQITAPDTGMVYLNGEELKPHHVHDIGYLPEERGLYKKMKVGEQAMYLAQLKGMSKNDAQSALKEWFEKFDIVSWYDKKVEELSKGMAQKVQFITTVIHKPKVLILDEPFSGFDPINATLIRNEIMKMRDEGTTIFLSTHNMDSVEEICQEIALLNNGKKVLDGKVDELKNRFKKDMFEIIHHNDIVESTDFTIIATQVNKLGQNRSIIRLGDHVTLNSVLSTLISGGVAIIGVSEIIPSMRDIFIEVIESNNNTIINTHE